MLPVMLKECGLFAAPARVLLDKAAGVRVRPVDQLIDGGNIAIRADMFATMVAMPVYPECVGVW